MILFIFYSLIALSITLLGYAVTKSSDPGFKIGDVIVCNDIVRHNCQHMKAIKIVRVSEFVYHVDDKEYPTLLKSEACFYKKVGEDHEYEYN